MRWLVVAGSPPLPWRPSLVAQAQPPGPGLPEQAPSVHTSRAPGTSIIARAAALRVARLTGALAAPVVAAPVLAAPVAPAAVPGARAAADPSSTARSGRSGSACWRRQPTWARRDPALAISSPGLTGREQRPQVVGYLAVRGTASAYGE